MFDLSVYYYTTNVFCLSIPKYTFVVYFSKYYKCIIYIINYNCKYCNIYFMGKSKFYKNQK